MNELKELRTTDANYKLVQKAINDYCMNLDIMADKYEDAGLNQREIAFAIARAQHLLEQYRLEGEC